MTLLEFCCWIWKVSLATRWPLTKTPKVPESTYFDTPSLSFLSAREPAKAASDAAKANVTIPRILVSNFTRLLLVRRVSRSVSGQAFGRSQPQFHPPCGGWWKSLARPFGNRAVDSDTAYETA